MVAVQMGDKDDANLGETQTRASQLQLGSLSAIDKEQFAAHLHDLR
jgi:hypothetical protein